jgi:putative acyl-CoA dehydrogenase
MMCLDVLRAMRREPASLELYLAEVRAGANGEAVLERFAKTIEHEIRQADDSEFIARRIVEKMALAMQARLMNRFVGGDVATAFTESRIVEGSGRTFGILASKQNAGAILQRQALSLL